MTTGDGTRRWLPMRLAIIALVVLVALLVAILARPGQQELVLETYRGLPAAAEEDPAAVDLEPGWVLGEDGRLAVYAVGSSTCPWTPTSVTADGDRVTVALEIVDGPQCTADLVPTTHVVALPSGVDPDRVEVDVRLVDAV
ncbi:hypothetical protein GCM10023216_19220 [Isoptericola chiayiensis]|uniref:Secreted protein n=1 Tax=Isoptericola chiayiensis TaxID=579446 RepID=A0ABP8YGX8_9MICO|nr:hypothetical protein [Isoptericola chiayiensis]NOW00149.1 hypothetical protein [Isoptericola chiayiensis]